MTHASWEKKTQPLAVVLEENLSGRKNTLRLAVGWEFLGEHEQGFQKASEDVRVPHRNTMGQCQGYPQSEVEKGAVRSLENMGGWGGRGQQVLNGSPKSCRG